VAITICIGVQKGGVGKTTTACVTAFLLSRNYKTLVIDFDSQGNSTQILTGRDIYQFEEQTILEAIMEEDAKKYTLNVKDNLDIIPTDDLLENLNDSLRKQNRFMGTALRSLIESVSHEYDYIIIDTPPNLGKLTVSALAASDYVVPILQSEPLCFKALPRYLKLIELVKRDLNPSLQLAGILPTMVDSRTTLDESIIVQARLDYEDWMFNTVIKRKSRIKEFSLVGVTDKSAADRSALQAYQKFIKELLARVQTEPIRRVAK
jgi:chromosome partitioning protein